MVCYRHKTLMHSLNALNSRTLPSNPPSALGVVGVVVIHYQHPAVTQQCLDALSQQQGIRIALRLVDNSKDGDAPAFIPSDNFHSFHRLRGENHGFSHVNNLGLADLRRNRTAVSKAQEPDGTFGKDTACH